MLNAYLWTIVIASYITTILYAYDKILADKHEARLSELYALITTALGGALGAIIGMILFNHKSNMSKKWYYCITLIFSSISQTLILLVLLDIIKL